MIRLHREQQAREVLLAACNEASASGNVDQVIERFLYTTQELASSAALPVSRAGELLAA